jgi:hypothetical protein
MSAVLFPFWLVESTSLCWLIANSKKWVVDDFVSKIARNTVRTQFDPEKSPYASDYGMAFGRLAGNDHACQARTHLRHNAYLARSPERKIAWAVMKRKPAQMDYMEKDMAGTTFPWISLKTLFPKLVRLSQYAVCRRVST